MPKIYDAIVIGSGAGGGMYAKVLTEAGASVLLIDAGSHQIDRDIRHHQWTWELPYRNQYQQDEEYTVRLPTIEHTVGSGDREHEPCSKGVPTTAITTITFGPSGEIGSTHFLRTSRTAGYGFALSEARRTVGMRIQPGGVRSSFELQARTDMTSMAHYL